MDQQVKTYHKILVVKLRFHGDMLLTTPLISTLKRSYPNACIDVLLYADTQPILSENPDINQLYGIKRKNDNIVRKVCDFISLRKKLRNNHYDLIINLADQWPIALLIKSLGVSRIISFNFDHRQSLVWKNCFTDLVDVQGEHTVEQNLSILSPLYLPKKLDKVSMIYQNKHWLNIKKEFTKLHISDNYIVIQPTARQAFKCWDEDKFAAVIDYLSEKKYDIILTSGPGADDIAYIKHIYELCQHKPITNFAGKTSLLELAALIDHATLFIGVDSAPMHMAAALDTPIVCLFGATNFKQWRPWNDNSIILWAGNYQKMPERKQLDRNYRYLSCIPAQDIIAAADQLLLKNKKNEDTDEASLLPL